MLLGGGRQKTDDEINYAVGLELKCKSAQKINVDDPLLNIHHDFELTDELIQLAHNSFIIKEDEAKADPLILKVID